MIDIQNNPLVKYFPFLASMGILFSCWGSIKYFLKKIFNLFIIEIDTKEIAAKSIQRYFIKNGKVLRLGKFVFEGQEVYVKPLQRKAGVIQSMINNEPQICLLNWVPILIISKKGEDKNEGNRWFDERIKVYFFRFTLKPINLLENAINEFNRQELVNNERFFIKQIYGFGRQQIISNSQGHDPFEVASHHSKDKGDYFTNLPLIWSPTDLGYGVENKKAIERNYIFCDQTQILFNSVKMWKNSEDWYRERGIPFRRGALVYGKAGSGKSSCIRTICQLLDLPLYIFDLASLSNKELIEKWQECQITTPCAILFDDIDAIYSKRKLVNDEVGPSFDCLLNCISGALPAEGMFIFVTTNKVDQLDEALGVPDKNGITTRGGRLEIMIELNEINRDARLKIAQNILKGYEEIIPELINQTEGYTASQSVEVFSKKALERYWKEKNESKI